MRILTVDQYVTERGRPRAVLTCHVCDPTVKYTNNPTNYGDYPDPKPQLVVVESEYIHTQEYGNLRVCFNCVRQMAKLAGLT